ncbi:MAG: hypothetical protein J6L47_03140 [Alphaproteobacteria bacterium]|nr:hypothetical protein [Alphaproteobacteria bacterium]
MSSNRNYQIAYTYDELQERTLPDAFTPYAMLGTDAVQYNALAPQEQATLKWLVRASDIIDRVALRLDHPYNVDFEQFLLSNQGCKDIELALRLFRGQRGIFAHEKSGAPVALTRDVEPRLGRGLYPYNVSVDEFHDILIRMLESGHKDDTVRAILNQRTIVKRFGNDLKAVDYTNAFKFEFRSAAYALQAAASNTSNPDFKEYLMLQSAALMDYMPLADCQADKKWATLQSGPLEFTLGRECYDDAMTPTVLQNPKLKTMLDNRGIIPYAKDNLGTTVGIVDTAGTDYLLKIKQYLPRLASKMPRANEYKQVLGADTKQTMVDVDVVSVGGNNAAYRSQITLAFNLPNADKLAIQTGGGHRTVYLKQMRQCKYSNGMDAKTNALLAPAFHKYFSVRALHDFTILHENMHTLGPKDELESLGEYKNIIEEHKADAGSIAMLDELVRAGFFAPHQRQELITSWLVAYLYPGANFSRAHAKRNIMQHNMLFDCGAIRLDSSNRMVIDFDAVIARGQKMLCDVIDIQLSKNPEMARRYIEKYAVWSPQLDVLGSKLANVDKQRNSYIVEPLADMLRGRRK